MAKEAAGAGRRPDAPPAASPEGGAGGLTRREDIDWEAAERSPEFRELIRERRSFVVPATIFFFVWYFGFIILAGYAQDFMATRLIDGFTLGYALALTQFIVTWGLSYWYIRRADRVFDPLAKRAAEKAIEAGPRPGEARGSGVPAS